jgi:hypothetical protein
MGEIVIFGIWPGVAAADLVSLQHLDCPPEDTAKTLAALREPQGTAAQFYVRAYRHFGRGVRPQASAAPAPAQPGLYAGQGRMIDLVASYQSPVPDPGGFAGFVRQAVRDVAAWGGGKVQVGSPPQAPGGAVVAVGPGRIGPIRADRGGRVSTYAQPCGSGHGVKPGR